MLALTSCYDTPKPACGFTCGANQSCPADYVCSVDNRCRLASGGDTSACPVATPAIDAAVIDAGADARRDAGVDAPIDSAVCVNLAPASDGSNRQTMLISEVSPGNFIELFNASDTDIAFATGQWGIQSGANSIFLQASASATTVPSRGYATMAWPAGFTSVDGGGELALYDEVQAASDFDVADKLVGYVCWGVFAEAVRKPLAETAGKWVSDCADALAMSAIRRKVQTEGVRKTDFSIDLAAEASNCSP
jgi:hypothetical protein